MQQAMHTTGWGKLGVTPPLSSSKASEPEHRLLNPNEVELENVAVSDGRVGQVAMPAEYKEAA